jgi:hypothetical protein
MKLVVFLAAVLPQPFEPVPWEALRERAAVKVAEEAVDLRPPLGLSLQAASGDAFQVDHQAPPPAVEMLRAPVASCSRRRA